RTAAKLEHPSIIPIYRVGKSGRVIYFVMKFLRGKPLSAVLGTRGALPVPEIKRTLIEVGRALAYAHKSGIVHRDIKPDNIMFDEHGQAVVTDFGIAKAAVGGKLTGTGMAIGTPHYMSPEQARAQQLDARIGLPATTPLPRQPTGAGAPAADAPLFKPGHKKSALAAVGIWIVLLVVVLGGVGFFAYKQGLLAGLFGGGVRPDSTAATDST